MKNLKHILAKILISILAGIIVGCAFYFFQNSNGFAPGGVSGLATITYHLTNYSIPWAYFMIAFNLPILILVVIFVNKRIGLYLILYITTQSLTTIFLEKIGLKPYSAINNPDDFEIIFACIATGVVSGLGFSIMLRTFGATGGTYAIAALIKQKKPGVNVATVSFILDSAVVFIAFIVYNFQIAPTLSTLINLFVANVVVDLSLSGTKVGYKFEIISENPNELTKEILEKLHHGVTQINVVGMYSSTDKYMTVCIVRKREIGEMMKIVKKYKGVFASFSKVNEVFGLFHK